eukprot:TRINITY_DN207_c0_g1_i2.p1 TRINITY_DN207_c0_g1~~TRINITY_DN207_c0_g1_i2.p1  ORF type:complete len:627 (-),score=109.22 TRINITY_DN207_c0_g1_i2:113-1753(-)
MTTSSATSPRAPNSPLVLRSATPSFLTTTPSTTTTTTTTTLNFSTPPPSSIVAPLMTSTTKGRFRFSAASTTPIVNAEMIPTELWRIIFALGEDPLAFRRVQLASRWFFNLYWDSQTRLEFSSEPGLHLVRSLSKANPSYLREVEIWNCPILPSLSPYFTLMSSLRKLVLISDSSATRKRGPTLNFLSSLPLLRTLEIDCLSYAQTTANPNLELIANITSLTSLTFTGYPIVNNEGFGLLCRSLPLLRSLSIDLPRASITDEGLEPLSCLQKLSSLSFAPANARALTDVAVSHICRVTTLQCLNISCSLINDFGFDLISRTLTSLTHLSLRGCAGITSFAPLTRLTGLTHLDISKLVHSGSDLQPLHHLIFLRALDLSGTQISDDSLEELIPHLPFLSSLNLAGCRRLKRCSRLPARLKDCVLPSYPNLATFKISRVFRWKFYNKRKVLHDGKLVRLPPSSSSRSLYASHEEQQQDRGAREARRSVRGGRGKRGRGGSSLVRSAFSLHHPPYHSAVSPTADDVAPVTPGADGSGQGAVTYDYAAAK